MEQKAFVATATAVAIAIVSFITSIILSHVTKWDAFKMNASKTLILQNLLGRLETAAPDVVSQKKYRSV